MRKYIILDKKVGETPLSALLVWKSKNPEYAAVTASYAGRLDPMASGKLLVLLGDECKKQRAYTGLDKEYEIEVLLGVASDTGDVLGMPKSAQENLPLDESLLKQVLRNEHGAHSRAYPAFSSKTVGGKPLFLYALAGTLSSIAVPEHIEHIYRIQNQGSYTLSKSELKTKISELLDLVPRTTEPSKKLGEDFRVDAIRAELQEIFNTTNTKKFIVLRLRVTCASGTYMRSLAGRIGASLGTKALALSITRTKIGNYIPLLRGRGWWLRTYPAPYLSPPRCERLKQTSAEPGSTR